MTLEEDTHVIKNERNTGYVIPKEIINLDKLNSVQTKKKRVFKNLFNSSGTIDYWINYRKYSQKLAKIFLLDL